MHLDSRMGSHCYPQTHPCTHAHIPARSLVRQWPRVRPCNSSSLPLPCVSFGMLMTYNGVLTWLSETSAGEVQITHQALPCFYSKYDICDPWSETFQFCVLKLHHWSINFKEQQWAWWVFKKISGSSIFKLIFKGFLKKLTVFFSQAVKDTTLTKTITLIMLYTFLFLQYEQLLTWLRP